MKKNSIIIFCLLFFTHLAISQNIVKETWDEKPQLHNIDSKYQNEPAVIILDKRRVEYIDQKDEIAVYKTLHRIVHINDDKGIESFNRIYLPVSSNAEIVDIKARTILPGGKVIELSKNDIKDLKEDDDQVYKIFAMEGLVKGCEIEYYYTYIRNTSFFGQEIFQSRVPEKEILFQLVAPGRLVFEIKSRNSDTKAVDTVIDDKRYAYLTEKDIPGAEEEKYCAFEANLKRVEYKLSYNRSRNDNDRLFTWDELAKRVFNNYSNISDKELKKVNDFIKDMKVENLSSETEKIVSLENFIKSNFATREDINTDDADNIEKIIKTRIASHFGIIRFYGALFRQLNIPFEFVLATDRKKYFIEKPFENWNYAENAVIYFPKLKKFMAPTAAEYRFPWIEPAWGDANALFCKSTTIGNLTTAFGEVKKIPLEDYTQSVNNTEADVSLNKTADTLLITISQIYSGYSASVYKAIFNFSSDENKRSVKKEMIKFGTKSENVVSSSIENDDFESYHLNKPFKLTATVKASELVERAGSKILVKIGDIIGPQVEMYQEKPRQFPMDIDYPHILQRNITFAIPEGYTVKNPDDLKINHTYQEKGETTMGFVSTYILEGNKIQINILEEYRKTRYPLSQYEDFKRIINAAADFNKVILVLEKK